MVHSMGDPTSMRASGTPVPRLVGSEEAAVKPTLEWRSGDRPSVQIGKANKNGQRCCGHRGVPGTDNLQYAYKVECLKCGYVYGANGTAMFERRCPECQGGDPGIPYWAAVE